MSYTQNIIIRRDIPFAFRLYAISFIDAVVWPLENYIFSVVFVT